MSKADKRKLVWLLSAAAALVAIIITLALISNSISKPKLPDGLPQFPGECIDTVKSPYGGVTAYYAEVTEEMFAQFIKSNPQFSDYSEEYGTFTAAVAYDTEKEMLTVTTIAKE